MSEAELVRLLPARSARERVEAGPTPGSVVGAIAAGTAPVPFLAVYSVLFIVHGGLHPVVPPDITRTAHGELGAGFVALGLLVVTLLTLYWFMVGARRWPFVVVQLALLVTCFDFVLDVTKGGRFVTILLIVTSLTSLLFAAAPDSWTHVGLTPPKLPRARRRPSPKSPVPR